MCYGYKTASRQKIQCISALNDKEAFYVKVHLGSPGLIWQFHNYQGPDSVHLLVLSSSTVTFHLMTQMTLLLLLCTTSRKGKRKERATNPFGQTQSHGYT